MRQDLAFASIRQGDLSAAKGWELLSPIVETDSLELAGRICDALRDWTWKAIDRRRRDDNLREWVDLLNKVEAFLAGRFSSLAAKIETLAELLHESLVVAQFADPQIHLRRKHVSSILKTLEWRDGEWVDRATLMAELGLKPANTTRLMSLLIDIGWIEQIIRGREAAYRISTEGLMHAHSEAAEAAPLVDESPPQRVWRDAFEKFRISNVYHEAALLKETTESTAPEVSNDVSQVWLHSTYIANVQYEKWGQDDDDIDLFQAPSTRDYLKVAA